MRTGIGSTSKAILRESMQRICTRTTSATWPTTTLFRPFATSNTRRGIATMTAVAAAETPAANGSKAKLHGRAFYESVGSPKYIVAPMVDQSEFAWRMLTRSFLSPAEQSKLLAYTPMLHARLFAETDAYRKAHFQSTRPDSTEPWLDGNSAIDRPLFVQFCANDPEKLLAAAKEAAPYCDAVDLNLGCPQGIARKGHYGAFLQEQQDLIFKLINTLHKELSIPVTAKIRILETKEKTLEYAQMVLRAGASILTVHGRLREQKGHQTGLADWEMLRFLRDSLPSETVIFANGNILQGGDLQKCLDATGADGIMSAEGNLSDPAIFATPPPVGEEGREYWRGKDGRGGWRVDAIMRRYLDILRKYAFEAETLERRPLFLPGDGTAWMTEAEEGEEETDEPAKKKRKKESSKKRDQSPNLTAVQPHLFHLLRHLVSKHTDVRDMLARTRKEGLDGYESVLAAVERKVAEGLIEYERTNGKSFDDEIESLKEPEGVAEGESSLGTIKECKRPWWVAQPIIRPLPSEAFAKGALTLSKKSQAKADASESKPVSDQEKKEDEKKEAEEEGKKKEIAERDALVSG